MISVAYEYLARLSIFVDVARKGELTSQHDRHHTHFEGLFHRLEADAAGGLYTLMCGLTTVFPPLVGYRANVPIVGRYRVQAIRSIRVAVAASNAERHIRDFTVVRTLRNVALTFVEDARRMSLHYH